MRVEMATGWEDELDDKVADLISNLAQQVYTTMVATAPVDTGRLVNDLDWEVDGLEARIGARSVSYAAFVELGVSPHTINAKPGSALFWPGAAHPVNSVNHPGFGGTHFMRKALYKAVVN